MDDPKPKGIWAAKILLIRLEFKNEKKKKRTRIWWQGKGGQLVMEVEYDQNTLHL